MVYVAVLGYGTVGSGVVEVIEENKDLIAVRAMEELDVKYILDLREFPGDPYESKIVHDVNVILDAPEVKVVCETMGGVGAAYQFSKAALERGKSVCTSNKELVAKHGPELLRLAKEHNCNYFFEASVGGGIPIIRPIARSLTAERILRVVGILNGTTNYILTKMDKEGAEFDATLKEAQDLGYAERNPEADIEGHDAARKIAILSCMMTDHFVDSEKVYTEGISKITPADFAFAKSLGCTIRLLGMSCLMEDASNPGSYSDDLLNVMVAPFFVPLECPLAMVSDVFNGILVTGNMVGETMYYGKGAGKLPTASAVVSDVVDAARHPGKHVPGGWDDTAASLADVTECERTFFLRLTPAGLEAAKDLLPGGRVVTAQGTGDAGYVTPKMKEKDFDEKAAKLGDALLGRIRMLESV
ncbi:MAG: homoserine dehydrogenase [Lachnospiraceae bacterium]|nr:homoserine dehydrogenase [Lachnospiraceae bacterium]